MNNSRFLKLYKLVMEQVSNEQITDGPHEKIKQKIDAIIDQIPNINDQDYYKKALNFFEKKGISNLEKYEPIIRDGTVKVVPMGLIDGSITKESLSNPEKDISINNIKNKEKLNVFFYFLKLKLAKDSSYQIKSMSKSSLKAETAQINKINGDISKLGGEIRIQTPNEIKGPFNEVKKVNGTPKADAVLLSTKNENEKMFLSLKNGGKAAKFRQYGGKRDLAETDEDLLKNPFINKCYNAMIALFDKIYFKTIDKNIPKHYDFSIIDSQYTLPEYVFQIPEFAYDDFKKTKWGKDFGSNKQGINNVDALIDGNISFGEFKEELKDEVKKEDKIKLTEINGEFEQEFNPDLYSNAKEKSFNDAKDYQMCIVIARYNPKGDTSLNFGDIKHCRFGVWPIGNCRNYIEKTKQHFIKNGLETVYNGIFKK